MTKKEKQQKLGMFTESELGVMLTDLAGMPWQPERGYNERRSAIAKMRAYFGALIMAPANPPKNGKATP